MAFPRTSPVRAGLLAAASILVAAAALAAPDHGPGGHLQITAVAVDDVAQTFAVTGTDFDFGPGGTYRPGTWAAKPQSVSRGC